MYNERGGRRANEYRPPKRIKDRAVTLRRQKFQSRKYRSRSETECKRNFCRLKRTHRGQTTKPNGATHPPDGGQVPGRMPGCPKPDGGGARGTERQRNRHRRPPRTKTDHREATQKAPRGNAKGTEQRQNTEVFPREAHKKHTKCIQNVSKKSPFSHRFCTVYKAFSSVLRGFCKGCIPTHTTRKPLIYKALRRFDAYDNRPPTAEAELTA